MKAGRRKQALEQNQTRQMSEKQWR